MQPSIASPRTPVRRATVLLLAVFCLGLPAAGGPQPAAPSIRDLAWLAGCWESQRGARTTSEHWLKPSGNMMLGVAQTVRDGKTVEFEFMRIHEDRGRIYYTAKPSGQPEASFELKSLAVESVVFENPQHDFPQRIIYRKEKDGSLLARIEGERNGKPGGIDFPYQRGKCD